MSIVPAVGIPLERAISNASEVTPWLVAVAQQGWPFISQSYTRTDMARNLFAEHVLAHEQFTHLVMLDIDHDHPFDVVTRLVRSVEEDAARQVVTALSFRRGQPYEPVAYRRTEENRFVAVLDWEPGEVLQVDVVGCGAIIIAREVFERVPWPWFGYSYPARGEYPSDDVWFSERCRNHDVNLYVDTRIRNDHLTVARVNDGVFRAYLHHIENGAGRELCQESE